MKTIRSDAPRHTTRSRDAALRRLRRTNRWLIAGSAVLTGLFAELAASAFSGHPASAGAATHPGGAHTTTKPLQPPSQAPKAATPKSAQPESEAPAPSEAPAEEHVESPPPSEERAPREEPAPTEAPKPEVHESAPPPREEPSEPVVSGGS